MTPSKVEPTDESPSPLSTFLDRTETSRRKNESAKSSMPGGTTRTVPYFDPYPLTIAEATNETVTDVDGNTYVDFLNCYTAVIAGHCHPSIRTAITEQLETLDVVAACTQPEQRLAERLTNRIASMDTVRFANSGTEAVMMAARAVRSYTGRDKIALFEGSYNGSSDELLFNFHPHPTHAGSHERPRPVAGTDGTPSNVAENVIILPWNRPAVVEDILRSHGDELAGVITSPAMGKAQISPVDGLHETIAECCRDIGALYVLDEVIGYREGYHGAQDELGVTPDLTTMGKIIGGGLPIGAFGGRREVMDVFRADVHGGPRAFHSGTFTANLPTMAAANAALDLLDENAFEELNDLGEYTRQALRETIADNGMQMQVVGRGSMFNIWPIHDTVVDYRDMHRSDQHAQQQIFLSLMNRGYHLSPGLMGCLSLPMDVSTIDSFIEAVEETITELRPTLVARNANLAA